MSQRLTTQAVPELQAGASIVSGILQRTCACGNHTPSAECATCKQEPSPRRSAVVGAHMDSRAGNGDALRVRGSRRGSAPEALLTAPPDAGSRIPWDWKGAGGGALAGAIGGAVIGGLIGGPLGALIGAGLGALVGGVAGGLIGGAGGSGGSGASGGSGTSVVPTAISTTQVAGATPSLGPTYYGSVFKHTLSTTGGTLTPDVTVAELVSVTRDDFATGFTGVPLGSLTWGPGGTASLYGNDMYDNIGTNNINVTNFLPSPPKPGLPAVMETPQELHYRVGTGSWTKFADVPMVVTLRANVAGGYEVETKNNGVPSVQRYTGPT